MKQLILPIFLVAISGSVVRASVTQFLVKGSNPVLFEAVGRPSMLKIIGTGANASGEIRLEGRSLKGELKVSLSSFDTGVELRNRHMREKYLETSKFSEARFVISEVILPTGWTLQNPMAEDIPFRGVLTLKEVSKPVEGKLSVIDQALRSTASFDINLEDFNVGVPSYLGVTVAKVVHVSVELKNLERSP